MLLDMAVPVTQHWWRTPRREWTEDSRTQKDSGTILFIGDYLMVGNRRDYLVNGRVLMNVKIPIFHDKM